MRFCEPKFYLDETFAVRSYESGVTNHVSLPTLCNFMQEIAGLSAEKLGWGIFSTELIRMIPGVELTILDSNCCGIAGTYGFKKENYEVSQAIGKPLFDQIARLKPDYVACDCETCKWQIEMSTEKEVKNPISILAEALDLVATAEANK